MKTERFRLGDLWCRLMHPAPMWPVKGQYQCRVCLRTYRVPWEQANCPENQTAPEEPVTRTAAVVAAAATTR